MTRTVGTPLRTTLSVAALAALTLTACGEDNDDAAEFEAAGGDASAAAGAEGTDDDVDEGPELPQVDSGFTHGDLSQNVTVTDTQRPENDEVITPTGTLSINEVETIESVGPQEVGLDPQYEEDDEEDYDAEPLDYAPAEGEDFRVLNLSFTPDESADHGTSTSVAISDGGAQDHLFDLGNQQEFRVLVSASEEAQLVVSSDGHDQHVDIRTGEREADEVAAGYYREITQQDPSHTFPIEDGSLPMLDRNDEATDAYEADYDFHISSVRLVGWDEENGWASEGGTWLQVDYVFEIDAQGPNWGSGIEEVDWTLHAGAEGEEFTYDYGERIGGPRDNYGDESTASFAVPIETVDLDFSFAGTVGVTTTDSYTLSEGSTFSFESEALEVSFPDENFGSDASEVDEADEEDGGEDADGDQDDDADGED